MQYRKRNIQLVCKLHYIIIGFLSTEDKEAPGNYGLMDQTMALRYMPFIEKI